VVREGRGRALTCAKMAAAGTTAIFDRKITDLDNRVVSDESRVSCHQRLREGEK